MKKPTYEEIQKAKEILKAADFIESFWHMDDIIGRAKENKKRITKKQAREIAAIMSRRHDANIGINWEVIDCHIDMYFDDLKTKK